MAKTRKRPGSEPSRVGERGFAAVKQRLRWAQARFADVKQRLLSWAQARWRQPAIRRPALFVLAIVIPALGDQLLKPLLVQSASRTVRVERGEEVILEGRWPPDRFLFEYRGSEVLDLEVDSGQFDEITYQDLEADGVAPETNHGLLIHEALPLDRQRTQESSGDPACLTELRVHAEDEVAKIRFSPGELTDQEAKHFRELKFVPDGGRLRIELIIGTPPDGSSQFPGCERQLELADWNLPYQAPLDHVIIADRGREVRLDLQLLDVTAPPRLKFEDYPCEPDPCKPLLLSDLRIERPRPDGRSERPFEAQSAGSEATVELLEIQLGSNEGADQLQLKIGGRARLMGDRAPVSSLFHYFKDRPVTGAVLLGLYTALVGWIVKLFKLAFARGPGEPGVPSGPQAKEHPTIAGSGRPRLSHLGGERSGQSEAEADIPLGAGSIGPSPEDAPDEQGRAEAGDPKATVP